MREQCEKDEGTGKGAAVGGKRVSRGMKNGMEEKEKGQRLKQTGGGKVGGFFLRMKGKYEGKGEKI